MNFNYESPFLDQEAFDRRPSEHESLLPIAHPFEKSVDPVAHAQLLTESEARSAGRLRLQPHPKRVEALEMSEVKAIDYGETTEPVSYEREAEPNNALEQRRDETELVASLSQIDDEANWEKLLEADGFLDEELAVGAEPMPIPKNNPVPFAEAPGPESFWPIRTSRPEGREVNYQKLVGKHVGRNRSRRFLWKRSGGKRVHVGVDLYANAGDEVVACEQGTIVAFYPFCCGQTKTSWALLVEHPSVVVNYGEVAPESLSNSRLAKGSLVQAGQVIASVGTNPRGSSMLHFETWAKGTTSSKPWVIGKGRPRELLNPTAYLLALQHVPHGESEFADELDEGGSFAYEWDEDESGAADQPVPSF